MELFKELFLQAILRISNTLSGFSQSVIVQRTFAQQKNVRVVKKIDSVLSVDGQ